MNHSDGTICVARPPGARGACSARSQTRLGLLLDVDRQVHHRAVNQSHEPVRRFRQEGCWVERELELVRTAAIRGGSGGGLGEHRNEPGALLADIGALGGLSRPSRPTVRPATRSSTIRPLSKFCSASVARTCSNGSTTRWPSWMPSPDRPARTPLTVLEVNELRVAFGTRHVLTHNFGISDARYRAGDGTTPLGQRVQVTRTFVDRALALTEQLVAAMS